MWPTLGPTALLGSGATGCRQNRRYFHVALEIHPPTMPAPAFIRESMRAGPASRARVRFGLGSFAMGVRSGGVQETDKGPQRVRMRSKRTEIRDSALHDFDSNLEEGTNAVVEPNSAKSALSPNYPTANLADADNRAQNTGVFQLHLMEILKWVSRRPPPVPSTIWQTASC